MDFLLQKGCDNMAQYRKIPYGYHIVSGVITINIEEKNIVQKIYQMYADGLSYHNIATELTKQDIRYMPTKPEWNKNMVARILQNEVYLGTEKYPPIIDSVQFNKSESAKKTYTLTESKEIKDLKPLLVCSQCGEKVKRRVNKNGTHRWYCSADIKHISINVSDDIILKDIVSIQKILANTKLEMASNNNISIETLRLQNEIDRLLEQPELEVDKIKSSIMELAAIKYSLCTDTNYLEQAMLEKLKYSENVVDTKLLVDLLENIKVSQDGVSEILLKCGKYIRKGEHHD